MIKGIYPTGRYTAVTGGQPSQPNIYNTYGSHNNSGPQNFTGQMRYNPQGQGIEVFDGSMWQILGSNVASVGLTPEAETLLDWAREKRQEEVNLKMRMEAHPGLKDAYEAFKIMDALTLEEEKNVKQF